MRIVCQAHDSHEMPCLIFSEKIIKNTMATKKLAWRFKGKESARAKQKRVFVHMRTAKNQISLCILAVLSGSSLAANRIIGYYNTFQWRVFA